MTRQDLRRVRKRLKMSSRETAHLLRPLSRSTGVIPAKAGIRLTGEACWSASGFPPSRE